MKYSVYDYTRHAYDYYEGPGPGGTHAGSPPAPRGVGDIGASPETASWKLPAGAKRIGSGVLPQGKIASLDGADMFSDPAQLAVYAALVYFAWRISR